MSIIRAVCAIPTDKKFFATCEAGHRHQCRRSFMMRSVSKCARKHQFAMGENIGSIHGYSLPRGGRAMLMSMSRWAVLLALVLAAQAVEGALADAPDATNLYPGRYVAVCKPAPIVGCLCSSYSQGEMSVFPELTSTADHHPKDVTDSEYLQLVMWLRRTCTSLTGPANVE